MLGRILLTIVLAALPFVSHAQTATDGKVKIEWLGHQFYRFTSPKGVVVLTSPWLANPDGPVMLDSLKRTDFILVPNSHTDDMGNPLEIAGVSGAMVIAPGPLGNWLIEKGLKKEQFRRAGVGDRFVQKGLTFKIAPSDHDNTLVTGAAGGPAAAFLVTFENGFTVFYNGHSTMIADLALYAEAYKPDLAILGLTDPVEFAFTARLMGTNNPKLKRVIASHMRPDAPILTEGRKQLDALGLGALMYVPPLRRVEEY